MAVRKPVKPSVKKIRSKTKKTQTNVNKNLVKSSGSFSYTGAIDSFIQYFQGADKAGESWFQILDMFPIPTEIFAPDGTTVFLNRAGMEMINCKDKSLIIGKYNLLQDPVCMDKLGYREEFRRAFRGETIISKNFPAPIQDLLERKVIEEKPFEKADMDVYFYPVWKDDILHFVVCVFVVRNMYMGRQDMTKAKEYIDLNWQTKFDPKAIALSLNMSVNQLYLLFKKYTGITPGEYYKKIKMEHIKDKLLDKNLSIKQAFAECGENSQGRFVRVFKARTGLSPTEYRKQINK